MSALSLVGAESGVGAERGGGSTQSSHDGSLAGDGVRRGWRPGRWRQGQGPPPSTSAACPSPSPSAGVVGGGAGEWRGVGGEWEKSGGCAEGMRAGCGRRAGAVLGLLLAMVSCVTSLLQSLERSGAVDAWRRAVEAAGGAEGAGAEDSAHLRALHLALAAARAVEVPLLITAMVGAMAGRRGVAGAWLAWAPVAVGAGAAQTSLALAQLLPLMAQRQMPLMPLHTARMALHAVADILASLASVALVESFRRGGGAGAFWESRRSFELPPLPSRWAPQAPRNIAPAALHTARSVPDV